MFRGCTEAPEPPPPLTADYKKRREIAARVSGHGFSTVTGRLAHDFVLDVEILLSLSVEGWNARLSGEDIVPCEGQTIQTYTLYSVR